MRVLMLHNHYQIRGGEDESFASEVRALQAGGHEVRTLIEHNERIREMGNLGVSIRTLWSQDGYRAVRTAIRQFRPDVVHVQNFFPLFSPAVYYAANAEGVPVIQSLRNYRLLCPNGLFFRDGGICEDCMRQPIPISGIIHGCYRNSVAASAVVAGMISLHRGMRTWSRRVHVYVALTEFARWKFVEGGLPAEKIVVKPNFVDPDPGLGSHSGGFVLYVGRLSEEKGLRTLLQAWTRIGNAHQLKIVGDGPLLHEVQRMEATTPGVELLGRQPVEEVHRLMGQASVLVFPSEWYETFGRVAIEAFATGTPVIASDLGAMAEIVEEGVTGWHFPPGNVERLAERMQYALDHPALLTQMGEAARRVYETQYTAKGNLAALESIYALAQQGQKGGRS